MKRTQLTAAYDAADGPTIRVRAVASGEYEYALRRGDDLLGEGRGDVFTLVPRMITEYDVRMGRPILDENGKPKMRLLTAEEQFSHRWMERVDADESERVTTSQEAVNAANEEVANQRRPGRKHA